MKAIGKLVAWKSVFGLLMGVGFMALTAPCVQATNFSFNVSSGNWNTEGSWNPGGVPSAVDNASVANGGTVTVDSVAFANTFTISAGRGLITAGAAFSNAIINVSGASASCLQDGGAVTTACAAGTYFAIQNGGSYTQAAGRVYVGAGGYGVMLPGTYVLQGGTLETTALGLGYGGSHGYFYQYGGLTTNTSLNIGPSGWNPGSYYQYGGTNDSRQIYIGAGGASGFYMITNGTLRGTTSINLGLYNSGSARGTLVIDGTANVETPALYLGAIASGNPGIGVATQYAGTVTISGGLYLGAGGLGCRGEYTLGGGTATISTLFSSHNGGASPNSYSIFTQTGGVLSATTFYNGNDLSGTGIFSVVGMAPRTMLYNYDQRTNGTLALTLGWNGGMQPIVVSNIASLHGGLTIGRMDNAKFEYGMVVTAMTYKTCSTRFDRTNFLDNVSCRVNYDVYVDGTIKAITLDQLQPALMKGTIISIR